MSRKPRLEVEKIQKDLKAIKQKKRLARREIAAKMEEWNNLPQEQWTDARKKRNGITDGQAS